MTTVLPDLERDLVQAAARHAASLQRGRLRHAVAWIGRRSRPGRLLFGLAVVSAAAASAATLLDSNSLPLSGAIRSNQRYRITIAPWLDAGVAGWCVADRVFDSSHRFLEGGSNCSSSARAGSPLVVTSYGGPVATVITAPGVAAVKVSHGPTILTRADTHLPFGFRAAVFRSKRSYSVNGGLPALTALDAHGRTMPGGVSPRSSLPTLVWARPGERAEVSSALASFPHHGTQAAHAAPRRGCVTAAAAGSGLVALGGVDVTEIVAERSISGGAFLDCSDTLYRGEGSVAMVSVLLDAKHPSSRPAALPDSRPVRAAAGLYTAATPLLPGTQRTTARRVGDAWLVARSATLTTKRAGGSLVSSPPITRAQEIRILRALTIAAIHVHAHPR
jgi:hypothetical protein